MKKITLWTCNAPFPGDIKIKPGRMVIVEKFGLTVVNKFSEDILLEIPRNGKYKTMEEYMKKKTTKKKTKKTKKSSK